MAKNFILDSFKGDFLNIFCTLRFQIVCISAKYRPILTNHTPMESLFIQLSDFVYISIFKKKTNDRNDGFVFQGHILQDNSCVTLHHLIQFKPSLILDKPTLF